MTDLPSTTSYWPRPLPSKAAQPPSLGKDGTSSKLAARPSASICPIPRISLGLPDTTSICFRPEMAIRYR
ncbi:hypothetical protein KIPE111705_07000 [Kibdelosporangium persicum]